VEVTKLSGGWIRWLINSKVDPEAEMTLGIVRLEAHSQNPVHVHHNCAEYLYVLSGSCRHRVGKQWVTLKAGDAVRIPAGITHTAKTLDEPLQAVIVYDSGERDFVVIEDEAETARE
jgi:quercetin dioxygenase-like cupin family protein